MLTRRDCLERAALLWAGAALLPLLAACGGAEDDPAPASSAAAGSGAASTAPSAAGAFTLPERAAADPAALAPAVAALHAFAADLHRAVLTPESGNVIASAYSAMVALGMARAGAGGTTASEMDAVLHAPQPAPDALAAGLNALEQLLESRAGAVARGDGSSAEIALDVANSLWIQHDLPVEQAFLDAVGRCYGPVVQAVDYAADPEAARVAINAWVAERTHDRIPELIAKGLIDAVTRLVLTNAIYLKAPWEEPFAAPSTAAADFTRLDGSVASVQMMRGGGHWQHAAGDGMQRVRVPYAGGRLAMTLIVPDAGRFAEVEAALDAEALAAAVAPADEALVQLGLPRFSFRSQLGLGPVLAALGMPTAFGDQADLTATADVQPPLRIGAVVHEAFIAVDEEGTEAAAATAVIEVAGAAPAEPVELVVDRPFLLVIHDVESGAPLFLGRVVDPVEEA